jgi:hypothetical protein
MRIETVEQAGRGAVTTLSGQVRDQAALIGVINSLYELHLKILSVHCDTGNEVTNGQGSAC